MTRNWYINRGFPVRNYSNMLSYSVVVLLACAFANAQFRPRLDGRIVGGHDVDIQQYPHQLSLQYWGSHICGASIISANWVLTASHCVDGSSAGDISFRAGSSTRGSGGTVHQATRIVMHPKYGNLDWDYALVQVEKPFPIGSSGVNAVRLATSEPSANTVATVTGWGALSSGGSSPRQLQGVDVHIVSRTDCNNAYGGITQRMICAADSGKDSCQGDSGGPLINKATGEQIGVVSWGRGCAEPGYPGVYSNVAAARDWISQVTGVY